jgi:class 3 adenylate cyclase/tetratricopeptide (TPR) repeat protein
MVQGSSSFEPYVPALAPAWAASTHGLATTHERASTVMFDISGFTRLTERLADRGRAGAEELSDILDRVFGPLVEVALEEGCDLLKWGGDAVFLLARGPDAPTMATRAALRMRAALGRVGHLRTTVGPVLLRASSAVATGEVHLVLAGDPTLHRELLAVGPAVTTATALEKEAGPGQVLLDARTARALGTRCVGDRVGHGRLAVALPPRAPGQARAEQGRAAARTPDPQPRPAAALLLPPTLRDHLALGPHEPEHRVVTAAFVRFEGTDGLLAREGEAALAEALDDLVRNVQDATHRHGVSFHESDVDVDGGKIMLVAGAPLSTGDDVDHLLDAVRLVVSRSGPLPVRVGVAQGRVFVGELGPPARRTYSVKGGAVNLAARLAARATAGTVRVPASLLEHARVRWQVSERQVLQLKGIRAPVPTVAVGGPVSAAALETGADTVIVGRDRELQVVRAALERLGEMQGGALTISGEPGMGKTRLVTEVVREADDFRVLLAECAHTGSATPYAPLRALLGTALGLAPSMRPAEGLRRATELVGRLAPELTEQLPLLGAVFGVTLHETDDRANRLDDEFRTQALQRLVVDVLRAVLVAPTVIVIEDTHFMDRDTGAVLDQLLARSPDRPWLLLATRRDAPEGWTPPGDTLRLGPLGPRAASVMAELVTPDRPLPPAVARHLAQRSAGHPLFLRELALAAARGERLDDIPLTVEELVAVQVDALDTRARAVLRRAAVLGVSFTEDLLRVVVDDLDGPAVPLSRELRALEGFLVRSGSRRWRFRHTVHREVAYAGLPHKVRARLHGHVGDVLRERPGGSRRPEVLARHFHAAGRFGDAWGYARRAGHQALARAAPEAAAEAFGLAVEASRRSGEVPPTDQALDLESWGDAMFLAGRVPESDHAYAASRRLVRDDPVRVGGLLLKSAKVAQRLGQYPVALRRITTGLRALAHDDSPDGLAARARLMARRAVVEMSRGRYPQADAAARAAVDLAVRAGQDDALAQAHLVLHGVDVFTGRSTGEDHGAIALSLYERLGDLSGQAHARNNIAMRLLLHGEWPQALRYFREAAERFEQVGDAANAANAAYNSADLLNRQGRGDEALTVLAPVVRVARAVGDEELYALALREQGRAHARLSRYELAEQVLTEAGELFASLREPHEVCETDIAMAEACAMAGRTDEALELVRTALRTAERLGAATLLPSALRVRATALVEQGDLDGARAAVHEGLAASEAPDLAHERGFLLAVEARCEELAGDSGPGTRAAGRHSPARAQAAQALTALGVVDPPLPWATSSATGRAQGLPHG